MMIFIRHQWSSYMDLMMQNSLDVQKTALLALLHVWREAIVPFVMSQLNILRLA